VGISVWAFQCGHFSVGISVWAWVVSICEMDRKAKTIITKQLESILEKSLLFHVFGW
jgi:hypothetical protein